MNAGDHILLSLLVLIFNELSVAYCQNQCFPRFFVLRTSQFFSVKPWTGIHERNFSGKIFWQTFFFPHTPFLLLLFYIYPVPPLGRTASTTTPPAISCENRQYKKI